MNLISDSPSQAAGPSGMATGSGGVTPHAMASGGDGTGIWILYLRFGL